MNEDFKIVIPEITDNTLKLFVNNKFMGNVNVEQTSQIRVDVVEYINRTHDTSILDTFYFIGHRDSNTVPGEEIKITMDEVGNFSDSPWECNHVRRCMMKLIRMEREKFESKQ